MTTGFGFCPNCGAALTEAGQRFCAACGFTVSGAAASAAVPPPGPVAPAPPPWAVPPGGPVGAAPAKTAVSPTTLLVGALVIAAIVAVGFFAMNGSKASSSASASHANLFGSTAPTTSAVPATPTQGSGGGLVTLKPSTFSCSSPGVTISVWLPGSVLESAEVTGELDGVAASTRVVGNDFKKQSDGRWFRSATGPAADICSDLGAGKHVYSIVDSEGNLLAQGSFTITAEAATPTPAGGGGSITVQPSSFSCSDTSTQVTMTIVLPASLSASAEVTAELDGQKFGTATVGDGFTQQADGSWLSTDATSASKACSSYGPGKHTLSVLDAQDNVLATGSFTANQ